MKKRTWSLLCLLALGLGIALICTAVIVIDPFQIYRKATLYMPPLDKTTQVYANAGVARQYDYDSAIVGTSVTENFRPTQMDELLGGRFIKLCTSAGTAYNHALLLDLAFRTHDMRRIVYGLDVYSFVGEPDETGSEVPFYLYDDSLLNDVQYWLNRSVLGSFLPRCLRAWGTQQDDSVRDSMYCWAGQDEYGPAMLYSAVFTPPQSVRSADTFVKAAQENLEAHLLPYIKAHPETQFDIFFPPYSAAEWSNMASKGTLEAMLTLRGVCYDALCGYANVTIHDFAAREEWVTDIGNYKDTLHYGQWINDAITEAIAAGENVVASRAQLDAATAQLRAWANALMQAGSWIFPTER